MNLSNFVKDGKLIVPDHTKDYIHIGSPVQVIFEKGDLSYRFSKSDKNQLLVVIEMCALIFIIMLAAVTMMLGTTGVDDGVISEEFLGTLQGLSTVFTYISIGLIGGIIVHVVYIIFFMGYASDKMFIACPNCGDHSIITYWNDDEVKGPKPFQLQPEILCEFCIKDKQGLQE